MTHEINNSRARVSVYTDPFNKRIRIDDYAGPLPDVFAIIQSQVADWVEKLIVKSRPADVPFFLAKGFLCEAFIRGYFAGTDMYFMSLYFSDERGRTEKWFAEQAIIQKLNSIQVPGDHPNTEDVKMATVMQATALADLYQKIFPQYPTPLHDESHIKKTMQEGAVYVYLEHDGVMVSAASAEINRPFQNAELTDCATLPQAQGKGHMKKLLYFLEQYLKTNGIGCCYSIARSKSFSMNKAFAQLGYTYGGRLINNCVIYSGIEDMNVWYKA